MEEIMYFDRDEQYSISASPFNERGGTNSQDLINISIWTGKNNWAEPGETNVSINIADCVLKKEEALRFAHRIINLATDGSVNQPGITPNLPNINIV